jgi:hypothetical protein
VVVTVAHAGGGPASGGGRKMLLVYFGIINARDQSTVVSAVCDSIKGMFFSTQTVNINRDYHFVMLARISFQMCLAPSPVSDE